MAWPKVKVNQIKMESLGDTIAGGLGGLACVLAGQPLDTIKVKLQTYPHLYKSLYDSLSRTYLEEGLRGFYAGSASAIVSNVGENAVLFVCYGHCQRVVQWLAGIQNQSDLTVFQRASAGSLASVISSIAITPPDRVKCKMQVQRQALQDMRGLPQPGQLVHEGYRPSCACIVRYSCGERHSMGLNKVVVRS